MKRAGIVASLCVCVAGTAFGQQKKETTTTTTKESTTVTSTTKTVTTGGWDIITELWSMEDATPVAHGQLDLRFTGRWIPEPAEEGESADFVIQPSLVWGAMENLELSIGVPIWVGDNGDRGAYEDGNYDTFIGGLWRFREQEGYWPAMALASHVRIPTGTGSDKLDGELRLVLTNEYDSGIRSHFNGYVESINGTNDETSQQFQDMRIDDTFDDLGPNSRDGYSRDFQWGVVFGLDGPFPGAENLRWVVDYIHRAGNVYGQNDLDEGEAGVEWKVADAHTLGISGRANLDHGDDSIPDYSVNLTWSISLKK